MFSIYSVYYVEYNWKCTLNEAKSIGGVAKQSGRGNVSGCGNVCATPPKVWLSYENPLQYKKTTFYTISSEKRWEYYFSVSNKAFFWTRVASLKFSLRSNFKPKPLVPRKILCFRLKSILIVFLYKQYRNNCL